MIFDNKKVVELVIKEVEHLRDTSPTAFSLLSSLSSRGELTIFGGAVREIIVFGEMNEARDIDIVVSVPRNEDLLPWFENLSYRRTRFGGFHYMADGVTLDIWALGETWAFKEGLLKASVGNLPRSVFLTIDAVAVSISSRTVYEYRFFESLASKRLDIVLAKNPFPALAVLRSVVLRRRYDLKFSKELRDYISYFWRNSKDPLTELDEVQISHYGSRLLRKDDLEEEIESCLA